MCAEMTPGATPNVEWWKINNHQYMVNGNYFCHVVEEDRKIVGFLSYSIYREPATSKIMAGSHHTFVLPDYRKGAAILRLWRAAMKHLKEKRVDGMETTCFSREKPFWEERGFTQTYHFMQKMGE
jgi:hypothetical protein